MRVVLFDLIPDGHHSRWVRQFVAALRPEADVTVGVSAGLAERVDGIDASLRRFEHEFERIDHELEAFEELAADARADHAIHLCATRPVLRRWLRRRPGRTPSSILIFSPAALHYPTEYGTPLSLAERANARYKEHLVSRWRRRAESHAVFTLDGAVVERWSRGPGAPAFLLPEPPVEDVPPRLPEPAARSGCAMYGYFTPRKGVDLLAQALSLGPTAARVVLAGSVEAAYAPALDRAVERMRSSGVSVDARLSWLTDADALRTLSTARCAVIPYVKHKGTSRVLVEAATVGTPVVAHEQGMLGYLVRRHELGVAVDCTRPERLREAVLTLLEDDRAAARYSDSLARFAAGFTKEAFEQAVWAAFDR